jgi:dihydrofolate reductase
MKSMTILSMIVATANNRVIGKDNQMPWHLPADLQYFKAMTLNKPIIMGRKTFESIGRPLPGRRNIVITRDKGYQAAGIELASSVEEALALADGVEEVMVIGGGKIYQHCLPEAQRLYITHIDLEVDGDTYFPDYQGAGQWQLVKEESHAADQKNPYNYRFNLYEKVAG